MASPVQCPKCHMGTIKDAPMGSSRGRVVVCSNIDCFTWFHNDANGELTEDERITKRMQAQFTNNNSRANVIRSLEAETA